MNLYAIEAAIVMAGPAVVKKKTIGLPLPISRMRNVSGFPFFVFMLLFFKLVRRLFFLSDYLKLFLHRHCYYKFSWWRLRRGRD